MTIIVGQYDKGSLSIHGDKRVKGGHFNKRDDVNKIITLGETLVGHSGDFIGVSMIKEIYDIWIKDPDNKFDLHTLIGIRSFINTIKENSGIEKVSTDFIFINKDIQISIISEGHIEEMLFFDKDNGLLAIGSGTSYALATYANQLTHNGVIDIEGIFNVCSRFDTSCGKEYDSLYLN